MARIHIPAAREEAAAHFRDNTPLRDCTFWEHDDHGRWVETVRETSLLSDGEAALFHALEDWIYGYPVYPSTLSPHVDAESRRQVAVLVGEAPA